MQPDSIVCPIAIITIGSTIVLVCTLIWKERARQKRVAERLCMVCGYDLRSSPERCPECGTPIKAFVGIDAALDIAKLAKDWPDAPIDPPLPTGGEIVTAAHVGDLEAVERMLVEQMVARGLHARVEKRYVRGVMGGRTRSVERFIVLVDVEDEVPARAIVEQFCLPPDAPARPFALDLNVAKF